MFAEEVETCGKAYTAHLSFVAFGDDEAQLGTIGGELDLIAVLKVPLLVDMVAVQVGRVCGAELDEFPLLAVPNDGRMTAADGSERVVETHLTARVATDFNFIHDDGL